MKAVTRAVDHVGEWQLTLFADSPVAIFAEAARAIARQAGRWSNQGRTESLIILHARDMGTLLVDWLNELLARSEIAGEALLCHVVEIEGCADEGFTLNAEVVGRRVANWHSPLKAATYHDLEFSPQKGRWRARVLLDV